MQVGLANEAIEGGYGYSYGVGKLVGDKLLERSSDCDALSTDKMSELGLEAERAITTYAEIKWVIAQTWDAVGYSSYDQLR